MKDDEQRRGRPKRPQIKPPGATWRALVIGVLAARAFSLHGASADSEVTVTVTSYRICVLHGCGHTKVRRMEPGRGHTTRLGTKR
jgi:hypothetical protein